jgi:hypothetical protein
LVLAAVAVEVMELLVDKTVVLVVAVEIMVLVEVETLLLHLFHKEIMAAHLVVEMQEAAVVVELALEEEDLDLVEEWVVQVVLELMLHQIFLDL